MAKLGFAAALLLTSAVVACGVDSTEPPPFASGRDGSGAADGVRLGPDGMPVDENGDPIPAKLDGVYEMSNLFDVTSTDILPVPVNETLKALSNFKETPSQTIVDLMAVANVPVAPDLINAIPSAIRGFFLGWVDDHIINALYKNVPVTQSVTVILDDLASILTRFEVVSTFDLAIQGPTGDAKATHQVQGMAYHWSGKRNVILAPELVANLTQQKLGANAVLLEKRSPELESGRLMMGSHTFSVPIGSFAVLAADMVVKEKFGAADLRDALGKVVDCAAVAKDVSKRCIDPAGPGKICVDHETEIAAFCSIGLDILVSVVKNQIRRLDLPFLRLEEGSAQMWDAPVPNGAVDATIDRIDRGFWTAKVLVNGAEKPILSTFTGRRVGDTKYPSR